MNFKHLFIGILAFSVLSSQAATINWAASIDNGFSLSNGNALPIGSLVRLGYFRDSGSGLQLTDSQIQALADNPTALDAAFVEAGTTTIGSGLTPAIASHFSASSTADTGASGLNLAGKQIFLWVLNAATLGGASQQAILTWDVSDVTTNPDSNPLTPGVRWVFPAQQPIPGSTSIDLSDLTTGSSSLSSGAKLIIGSFPVGTSAETSADNFGLASIDQPLTISTGATLTGGVVGTSYSTTLAGVGGTTPYDWTISGGALPDGLSLAPATGIISGTPTTAGPAAFTVQLEDDLGAITTKAFDLTIASTALAITNSSPLASGVQGANYSVTFNTSGGSGSPSFSVESGTVPSGTTLTSGGTLSGPLSSAGTYNFVIKAVDSGSLVTTKSFTVVVAPPPVITNPSVLTQGVVNTAYSVTFAASGTDTFTWSVSGGTLPAGITLVGASLVGTPTTAGTSSFTIQAQGSGGNIVTKAFTLEVLSTLTLPTVTPPNFPLTAVGNLFTYTLSASPAPTSYVVTGLPAGLKLKNPATGYIEGRPTKAGVYMVRVKAKNGKGFSPEVPAQIIVQPMPNGSIGSFVGLVDREATVNNSLGGRIDIATTATGTFSGSLTLGGTVTKLKGNVDVTPGSDPQISFSSGAIQIALTLESATNTLSGTVKSGAATAVVSGWRNVWAKLINEPATRVGYYTAAIDLTTDIGSATVPQGAGFFTFTVGVDGKLSIVGKTSDGNTITSPGFVGPTGQLLVYTSLYSKGGTILGELNLDLDPQNNFTENVVSGQLTWSKPLTTGTTYPAAFGPLTLDADGMYMAFASKGSVVQGLPAFDATADLIFTQGGLSTSIPNMSFTYSPAFKTIYTVNATKTTLTITQATGAVKGGFTVSDANGTRSTTFQGTIVRLPDGDIKARGYFLLKASTTSTEMKSGLMSIEQ